MTGEVVLAQVASEFDICRQIASAKNARVDMSEMNHYVGLFVFFPLSAAKLMARSLQEKWTLS